jgi:hypothetical protein
MYVKRKIQPAEAEEFLSKCLTGGQKNEVYEISKF